MRKNSPLLAEINRALSTSINNGVVTKAYRKHLRPKCPPFEALDKEIPLTLANLGSLFGVGLLTAFVLAILKTLSMIPQWNRPKLPLRSVGADQVLSRPPPVKTALTILSDFTGLTNTLAVGSSTSNLRLFSGEDTLPRWPSAPADQEAMTTRNPYFQ